MKITPMVLRHPEFRFDFLFTEEYETDHRRELIITIPFVDFCLGFDW